MCIALNRAITMMKNARTRFPVTTSVPSDVDRIQEALQSIRDAFEHIDERAFGNARREESTDAMSIFDQADLISDGILRYGSYSLNLQAQVTPVLIAARKFIYDVIAESGITKTINTTVEFGPVTEK